MKCVKLFRRNWKRLKFIKRHFYKIKYFYKTVYLLIFNVTQVFNYMLTLSYIDIVLQSFNCYF